MNKFTPYLSIALSCFLASCASEKPKMKVSQSQKPSEYFAETEYGVKASPRVVTVTNTVKSKRYAMPRGGGREMVGKPYKVRGKWYYPREEQGYVAQGKASWYGDAFHGRLTANGEVYDMHHLSAAHPTMPLPSYARVTNIKNGKSVIVRVNDRGPYSNSRIVDLSKRAAQLLDYTRAGTATVKIEYVGRAPTQGRDDEYLMASFRDGNQTLEPVMVAENAEQDMPPLDKLAYSEASNSQEEVQSFQEVSPIPPEIPLPIVRPEEDVPFNGYAPVEPAQKADIFSQFLEEKQATNERILLGVYDTAQLKNIEEKLNSFAKLDYDKTDPSHVEIYVTPIGGLSIDQLMSQLWSKGYNDAFIVR
jgi:rare lipoprotein A (peptidoglycan hydrolase)